MPRLASSEFGLMMAGRRISGAWPGSVTSWLGAVGRPRADRTALALNLSWQRPRVLESLPVKDMPEELEHARDVGLPLRPPVEALAEVDEDVQVELLDPAEEVHQAPLEGDERRVVAQRLDGPVDLAGHLGDGLLREALAGVDGPGFVGVEDDAHPWDGIGHGFMSA